MESLEKRTLLSGNLYEEIGYETIDPPFACIISKETPQTERVEKESNSATLLPFYLSDNLVNTLYHGIGIFEELNTEINKYISAMDPDSKQYFLESIVDTVAAFSVSIFTTLGNLEYTLTWGYYPLTTPIGKYTSSEMARLKLETPEQWVKYKTYDISQKGISALVANLGTIFNYDKILNENNSYFQTTLPFSGHSYAYLMHGSIVASKLILKLQTLNQTYLDITRNNKEENKNWEEIFLKNIPLATELSLMVAAHEVLNQAYAAALTTTSWALNKWTLDAIAKYISYTAELSIGSKEIISASKVGFRQTVNQAIDIINKSEGEKYFEEIPRLRFDGWITNAKKDYSTLVPKIAQHVISTSQNLSPKLKTKFYKKIEDALWKKMQDNTMGFALSKVNKHSKVNRDVLEQTIRDKLTPRAQVRWRLNTNFFEKLQLVEALALAARLASNWNNPDYKDLTVKEYVNTHLTIDYFLERTGWHTGSILIKFLAGDETISKNRHWYEGKMRSALSSTLSSITSISLIAGLRYTYFKTWDYFHRLKYPDASTLESSSTLK